MTQRKQHPMTHAERGRLGGLARMRKETPASIHERAVLMGMASARKVSPEHRKHSGRLGGTATAKRLGSDGMRNMMTPEQRRIAGQHAVSRLTREMKSKGGVSGTHVRWHIQRGKLNPDKCELCAKEQDRGQENLRTEAAGAGEVVGASTNPTGAVNPSSVTQIPEQL